jgi:hypothetical protein
MSEYFESGAPYRPFVDQDKPARAVEEAIAYLAARRNCVGDQQYRQDHKGTPFYILGYSAFACHDYTSASLYFDAAAEADLRLAANCGGLMKSPGNHENDRQNDRHPQHIEPPAPLIVGQVVVGRAFVAVFH